ncbi:MAG: ABC transporter ATP-binding protein [Pseudomonadota bacterium]
MTADVAIHARTLRKRYGAHEALRGVDLDLDPGQICTVLGPNGAGKTTLIQCALGLIKPNAGEIALFGERAGSLAARRLSGVMLQDTDLPDLLTGREQLTLQASYFPTPRTLEALIDETDIGAFVDQRYKTLSGGQKRRVQFAMALVGRPRVLFLDEPTTGLDRDARKTVWEGIRRLTVQGTTVVLTTHYLEEADALADRVVVLNHGLVIAADDDAGVRARVGGALIRCSTTLDTATLGALPAVRHVSGHGRLVELLSDDTPKTLAALLAVDPAPGELTVRKPSLEEAFSVLTGTSDDTLEARA